jgi:tetratricopeptide (TPR) repeat protein
VTGHVERAGVGQHFEAALARLPAYGAAYVGLADSYLALGDPQRALAALRKGKTLAPTDARLLEAEAGVLRRLEKPREAMAAFEAALPLAPKDALLRVKLAEMYRDAREPAKAVALLQEAVALEAVTLLDAPALALATQIHRSRRMARDGFSISGTACDRRTVSRKPSTQRC